MRAKRAKIFLLEIFYFGGGIYPPKIVWGLNTPSLMVGGAYDTPMVGVNFKI